MGISINSAVTGKMPLSVTILLHNQNFASSMLISTFIYCFAWEYLYLKQKKNMT